jgi:hypothetical protein
MDLEEFRQDFHSQVNVWATADENFQHAAFVDVAVRYLEDAGEVSDFQTCYYRGTSRRRNIGVDGYAFDNADSSIRLFLADPTELGEATLTQTDAKAQFSKVRAFAEDSLSGRLEDTIDDNSPARQLADELSSRRADLSRIRVYLLTDATLSVRVKDWPEGEVGGIPIEFHIWDLNRFYRVHASQSGQDEIEIDFSAMEGGGIPCLEASNEDSPYSSYLCVLPGPVLADIYDLYGSRLLEGNVRSFLNNKGRTNKGIRNTVVHQPEMFFAYNNGIAATASRVGLVEDGAGLRLVSIADLQIVNGGQTTASLSSARRVEKASLDRTFVPMKLSVISPDLSADMVPLISRYANSQNKVSDADFFANHPFHRRLETISRRIWAPAKKGAQHETRWFYERARGQYSNETIAMGISERRRFLEMHPRDQVITKTELAKVENSWLQLPHQVSKGAQSNFLEFANRITREWTADKELFNENYFRLAVARVILFKEVERIISKQAWYSGGYRANLVTYAIAKIAFDISVHSNGMMNFGSIWQHQDVTPAAVAQVARTSEQIYAIITSPPPGRENVTQWCKREECWQIVKDSPRTLTPDFIKELVAPDEQRSLARTARRDQKVDSGIDDQSQVVGLGLPFWQALLSWASDRTLLSPEEERIVKIAAGFVGGIPSDKQSARLLSLKQRIEREGFGPQQNRSPDFAQ